MKAIHLFTHNTQVTILLLQGLGCTGKCWCTCRSNTRERVTLLQLFGKYALPAIAFVLGTGGGAEASARLRQALPATDLNMVQQLCELLALQLRDSGRIQRAEAAPSFCKGLVVLPILSLNSVYIAGAWSQIFSAQGALLFLGISGRMF